MLSLSSKALSTIVHPDILHVFPTVVHSQHLTKSQIKGLEYLYQTREQLLLASPAYLRSPGLLSQEVDSGGAGLF
jgi:hypothetical protein